MAKKKSDAQTESDPHKPQNKAHHNQTMDEAVPEKLDSLKSLNTLLLKETTERRQQVNSLVQSNGYLESKLKQSVMDNASLQSEMNALIERAMMLEIEKGLVSVFVTLQTSELLEERIESLNERIGSLEGEMVRVLEEKSEIEKSRREKGSEIEDLKIKIDKLLAEFDEQGVAFSSVRDERDEIRTQLDARIREVNELRLKVTEVEENEARILDELTELKVNHDRLVKENTASKKQIQLISSEKDLIQENLVESNGQINNMKRNVEELLEQKTAIEDEKNTQEEKNNELQTSVGELKDLVETMKTEEKALLEKIADLEKQNVASSKNEVEMQKKIDGLVEEKKEADDHIESLDKEKSLVMKELEGAMKELEYQKLTIEQIVQDKAEIENAKIHGENEIVKMKKQLSELKDVILSLESSSVDQIEKLKQLEIEASRYKSSFDQATLERDEAQERLNGEKTITTDFKQRIAEMEKEIDVLQKELAKMTTANVQHVGEKNMLENRCAALVKDIGLLETQLGETRTELDGTKSKLDLAEANLNRVLNILKKTLSSCDENTDFNQENGIEEGIKDHVTEVEAIKRVFKDKDSRVEEMERQLDLVKSSAAEAHKGKSFWTMVSSATTVLAAAVSVAYIARAH